MEKDIFISYSRKDTAVADRICKALDRAGISYFIDRQGLSGGSEFSDRLAHAIDGCKVFLFLASHNYYGSFYSRCEFNFAISRKCKVLPYIIDGSDIPPNFTISLSDCNWATIEDHPVETVFIEYIRDLLNGKKEHKDIFISYSRKDTAVADRICKALDRAGISYFIDRQGIAGGMEFPELLAQAIVDCKIFLFIASSNSYASDYTRNEITFAFNRKRKMLPYIIDGSTLPLALEFTFSRINWRTIEEHPVETVLVNDLLTLLGRPTLTSTSAPVSPSVSEPQLSAEEMYRRGDAAYEAKRYDEAVEWYRKAAEQGNTYAQYNLGNCYYYGNGVPQDNTEAAKWYRKAAEQGDADAQYMLGELADDFEDAVEWYLKAAEQGNADAQYELGVCYRYGNGVPRNISEAVKWYLKAAERGSMMAQYEAGRYYYSGLGGLPKDVDEAVKWYRKAAAQGHAAAQGMLSKLGLY